MAAVRHLGYVMRVFGPLMKGIWWSLSLQNVVEIDAVVSILCMFYILQVRLENAYSRPKKSFWGI